MMVVSNLIYLRILKKDFIPIEDCCEVIFRVISKKVTGVFNLGFGISVKSGDLAEAVIKGFGGGEFVCDSESIHGQFQMDVSSLRALIDYPSITTDSLLLNATKNGRQLREHTM
jgi:UDP-glucose 4-epimerase